MSSAQMPTAAFPQLGRYQIVQKLGEGGMGAVYLAQDTHLSRQVAVKILPPHSVNNPDAIARFQREARALAQLSHPNIIQAYDTGSEDGQHFLVMEYVEGMALAALVEKGPLPPARAAAYIHQAALALEHAHEKGLIHRDVKPSNLLVTKDGQVKLLDLGLSRFLQDQLGDASRTQEGVGMGTPDYAPPEQFRDAHNVDHRADIYSLGCTLYHLLTGRVPFPGSSLSEKYTAHATNEPTPLTELGIDAPGGLVLVLEKMMAKKPDDRFQTARAVNDALLPFVSASSQSFLKFRETASWHMGQVTMPEFPQRRRWLPWAVAGFTSMAALVLLALLLTYALRPGKQPVQEKTDDISKPDDKKPDDDGKQQVVELDPKILTVSKTEKDRGQYRTITEALEKVGPGQTIRVLDDAVYQENVLINRSTHLGIRLEAPRHAVLEMVDGDLVRVDGVQMVTVCGFQLRVAGESVANNRNASFIAVRGDCSGLMLERLTMEAPRASMFHGIDLHAIQAKPPPEASPPIVIRNNVIRKVEVGILLAGCLFNTYDVATPVESVVIRDNVVEDCILGIIAVGAVRRVQIVGNRVMRTKWGLQLEHLLDGTEDVLLANNTLLDCGHGLRIWDKSTRGKNVQVRSNLVLASKDYDFMVIDSGGRHESARGPGDGAGVAAVWRLDHNWREGRKPSGNNGYDGGWIPPAPKDVLRDKVDGYDDDPKSPHFLHPKKDSDLATKGAGNEEPSLPRYVGAMPPEGIEPWDWNRTWLAWPGTTKLLTVSKNKNDNATCDSIQKALKQVRPWDTIRVLDGATYEEAIALTEKDKCEGVCLEAVNSATLKMPPAAQQLVLIRNVPHLQMRGFQLSSVGMMSVEEIYLVYLSGDVTGVTLSGLNLTLGEKTQAIRCQNAVAAPDCLPLRVRDCRVKGTVQHCDGIFISGRPPSRLV